jgi:ATP-dependent DNA helicase DinG
MDLSPQDLGLPAKFSSYRAGQADAILNIAASRKRFSLLSAPTGAGKSIIYMSIAQMLGARAIVLTSTKGLQAQLGSDFSELGLTDVRGQNNYRCVAVDRDGPLAQYGTPGTTCDEGPCHVSIECPFKNKPSEDYVPGCLYRDAVQRASQARLVVTNYAYWMTANAYMEEGALGAFDLVILDEAHAAPDELADFCSVRIDRDEVRALLDTDLPPLNEGTEAWVSWAVEAHKTSVALEEIANRTLAHTPVERRHHVRHVKRLRDLKKKLEKLTKAYRWLRTESSKPDVLIPGMQTDWIAEHTPTGAQFSPVWAHAYAEDYLFAGAPRVVLVSAVLQRAAARYLGINDAALDFIEMESSFDVDRRPLIYIPTTRVDRNMVEGQVRVWVNQMDAIIGARLDRKGIIHTRSYDRAKTILQRSRYKQHMIGHTSRDVRDAVAAFKASAAPRILVSPSVEEGYDFIGDLCRYQILAKVPFIDTRSALMQARVKSDPQYSNYLTALSIIQQVGRGMRAEDDWSESFIIDDHWSWMRAVMLKQKLLPRWFYTAIRSAATPPTPPRMHNGHN